ncbi:hypothetical protein LTR16_004686, partial [Cryomyces antarcticus]
TWKQRAIAQPIPPIHTFLRLNTMIRKGSELRISATTPRTTQNRYDRTPAELEILLASQSFFELHRPRSDDGIFRLRAQSISPADVVEATLVRPLLEQGVEVAEHDAVMSAFDSHPPWNTARETNGVRAHAIHVALQEREVMCWIMRFVDCIVEQRQERCVGISSASPEHCTECRQSG